MGKQVRRILIGLAVILVSLAGLITVSALVPSVGCRDRYGLNANATHLRVYMESHAAAGRPFTVNGTLEAGFFLDPFPRQWVTIQVGSFQTKVITDEKGKFSCEALIDRPGRYTVSASYFDETGFYWASTDSSKLTVTGEERPPDSTPSSPFPYYLVAVLVVGFIAWDFISRRLSRHHPGRDAAQATPVWLYVILGVVAVISLVFSYFSKDTVEESSYVTETYTTSNFSQQRYFSGISVEMPEHGVAKQPVTFEGALWEWGSGMDDQIPLAGKVIFIWKMDGKTGHYYQGLISVTTGEDGRFTGQIVFKQPGDYAVEARFPQSASPLFSMDAAFIKVENGPPFATWDSLGWIIVYGLLIILLPASYQLFLRKRRFFAGRGPGIIMKGLPVVLLTLELAAVYSAYYPESVVKSRMYEEDPREYFTRIELASPEQVPPEQAFDITGMLAVDKGPPVVGKEIDIWLTRLQEKTDAAVKLATLVTDNTGSFAWRADIDIPGQYEVSAVFYESSDLYFPSSATNALKVINPLAAPEKQPENTPDWLPLVCGAILLIFMAIGSFFLGRYGFRGWVRVAVGLPVLLFIIAAGYLLDRYDVKLAVPFILGLLVFSVLTLISYFLGRYYGLHRPGKKQKTVTLPLQPVDIPAAVSAHAPLPRVHIKLPQISVEMPDVWGKDDDLLIVFAVDGSPQMLAQYSLDIELEPGTSLRSLVAADGRASWTHTFCKTGVYNIQAVLVKEVRNGYLPASRLVRIVDYREEIVRLYNEMLASLKIHGVLLIPKMTAREVETRLMKAFPSLSSNITSTLVSVFEEANYSLHPISRPAYEQMFRVVQEITGLLPQSGVRHE